MKKRLTIFLVVSLLSAEAFGQAHDSTLTFREAVRIALKNSVLLNTERNNLLLSKVNRTYRIAQLGPQVGINGNLYQSNGNRFIQQELKVVNTTAYGGGATLNVSQPIFNGLGGMNAARQASSQLDAQLEQVERSTEDIINTVSTQFLQVLLDQELLKIALENLELQKTQYEQVKAQVEVGSRSPVDEYNQQAQVSNAEFTVAQAEFTLVNDKITLLQSLLLDPTMTTKIVEPKWDVNAIALDDLSLAELLEVSSEQRSDLKEARYSEKASRFAMSASKSNYFPRLNAFYNNGSAFNQVKGTPRDDPDYRSSIDQFTNYNRSSSFGLSLYIPIFTGFESRAFYMQSKIQYENNKLLTKNQEVIVKGDVLRAYENFQSVKKAYAAGLTGLEASEMAYSLEKERFNLGITSFVDFANANRTYIQAQTDMAQAKYRFIFQKIMLDYAVGTLNPDELP